MATKGLAFWSETADTNASADSSVNWAEGQAPSSINNSARAMMGSLARYRNDISGNITTGGTSTAYTATTSQDFATLAQMNAQVITIVPHVTNGAAPTLAVNGLTAKQIRTETGVSVGAGVMIAGTPYQLVYFSSAGEFILMNFATNPYIIPIGALLPWTASAVPNSNFVFPSGQAISRTTYSAYFSLVGTFYGVGDSSTTFNILNVEGRVIAGLETSATLLTTAVSGVDGGTRGATGGAQSITLDTTMIPAHTHDDGTYAAASDGAHSHTFQTNATIARGGSDECADSTLPTGTDNTNSGGAHTHDIVGTSGSTGGGLAHRNVQPTIVLPYILRII